MPALISFFDADPRRDFRPALEAALRTATGLDAAVAFVTRAGVDFFLGQVRRLGPGKCRLTVSVQFPTDLDALSRLSGQLGDNLHIHLGSDTPHEVSGKPFSPLMHSKVVWMDRPAGEVTVFVGSHNWTSTALDGVNMEAAVRAECQAGEPFALAAKAHLDACFAAGVRFQRSDPDFYRAIQARLYPARPELPGREAIEEFIAVPDAPAVVIHAEDHRTDTSPRRLLLYLPLRGGMPHGWFSPTAPTRVFLYLYPPGTLIGRNPPSADPSLFEGVVRTFNWVDNPITGQKVNSQVPDLDRPLLETVSPENMPPPSTGVDAQVVAVLHHQGQFPLPVYSQDAHRPGVRVEAVFEEPGRGPTADSEARRDPVPTSVATYFTPESIRDGRFVFRVPHPTRTTTIQVPGGGFYRVPPVQVVQEVLLRSYRGVEVEVDPVETNHPYLYRVRFVFRPPPGSHGRDRSLFD